MLPSWDDIFYKTEDYFTDDPHVVGADGTGSVMVAARFPHPRPIDLTSPNKKILLKVHGSYFHLLTETIPVILKEMNNTPGVLEFFFVVTDNLYQIKITHIEHVLDYIIQQLNKKGYPAKVLSIDRNTQKPSPILLNNFCIAETPGPTLKYIKDVVAFMLDGISIPENPSRKIYLSRGKTLSNNNDLGFLAKTSPLPELQEKYKYVNKSRIDDEKAVEEYMSSLGYEIIYPEEISSFKEQLDIFVNTRSLASITGAGMTSLIFMKPGSKVIEFLVPLTTPVHTMEMSTTSIHPHYYNLSYDSKHSYVAIPHEKIATDLIKTIESTPGLKEYIAS